MQLSFPSYHPKETDDKPGSRCWKRLFNQPKWLFFFYEVSHENYVVKSRWAHNRPQSKKCNKMWQRLPAKASLSLGSSVCLLRHHRAEIYNSSNAGGQQRVKETRKSWPFLTHTLYTAAGLDKMKMYSVVQEMRKLQHKLWHLPSTSARTWTPFATFIDLDEEMVG